ncbi:MAG: 2-oxo acid dehydrogenase subunit E2 [Proteobacteria bacterium]|nr:2-oxo acid dehydrogenase subunit E2 [Pseudomonadota bacterium]
MATEVIIPALGVVVEEVKILKWLKSEGDLVKEGEPLLEIESEKVTTEITSPASGILGCILYPEGVEVPITRVAALIVAEGEAVPESYRQKLEEAPPQSMHTRVPSVLMTEKPARRLKAAPAAQKLAEKRGVDLSLVRPTGPHGTIMKKDVEAYLASATSRKPPQRVSTLARKEAERLQVPVEGIQGTGIRGRVMKADVLRAAGEAKAVSEKEDLFGKVIPMNKMRQVIARRMSESASSAPHIYLFIDINMEKVLNLREIILEGFEQQFNVRPSINDFLIKAVGLTIREYPLLNARIKGDEIHVHPEINVGLAVALDDGLIVPAIPRADELGLGTIAQMRADLVDRARKEKLTIEEVQRGTFTVSSLANFDISFFTAILNPPQSGILTVGKTQDQLYLEDGQVKTTKVANCGLSVDHRIVDGSVAAAFLQSLKKELEKPSYAFLQL